MNLIFFGPPNAGKGTYAASITRKYRIPHISTGDLFREQIKAGTELGKLADSYIIKGKLVPDEVTIKMLKERISRPDCRKGFILDGFPRTIPQGEALESSGIRIDKVLNFVVSYSKIMERVAGRRTCRKCGAIYHIKNIPPKVPGICDRCGGELYTRDDQRPEIIKERLRVYKEQTEPLVDFYKKRKLVVDIDANPEADVIVPVIEKVLNSMR